MISRCANPTCGKAFNYREGRFFRFRQNLAASERANAHSMRHLWLCGNCAERYSLEEASGSWQGRAEVRHWSASACAGIRLIRRAHVSPEAAVEV